jgi:acetyl esterase/lipase
VKAARRSLVTLALLGCGLLACSSSWRPVPAFQKQTCTYKTVGECEIKADVYWPPGATARPGILFIHGGALIFGSRSSVFDHQLERYLEHGFAVIAIDYRLAPETKLPEIIEDVSDAYAWVRADGPRLCNLDPDRIAVVGDSAGGYLALMAGLLSPRPKALVSFYGYGELGGDWTRLPDPHYLGLDPIPPRDARKTVGQRVISESETLPRVTFYNYCRQSASWLWEVAALDPDLDAMRLRYLSPARNVTRDYPPTMLLHGDRDSDVPFAQSVEMAQALEEAGVPHRLLRLEGYDHYFDVFPDGWPSDTKPVVLEDDTVIEAYDEVIAFLEQYLAGNP